MGVVFIIFPRGEYGNPPAMTQAGRRQRLKADAKVFGRRSAACRICTAEQIIRATEMSQAFNRSVFDWHRAFMLSTDQWQQSWLWTTSRPPLNWSRFSCI